MKGWMYILECSDGSYYTGSTNNLILRLAEHHMGLGSNHTKKRLPLRFLYAEEFDRIDDAFNREKQVQGWNRKKKEALMNGQQDLLSDLAIAYRDLRWLREPQPPDPPLKETSAETNSTEASKSPGNSDNRSIGA